MESNFSKESLNLENAPHNIVFGERIKTFRDIATYRLTDGRIIKAVWENRYFWGPVNPADHGHTEYTPMQADQLYVAEPHHMLTLHCRGEQDDCECISGGGRTDDGNPFYTVWARPAMRIVG